MLMSIKLNKYINVDVINKCKSIFFTNKIYRLIQYMINE